MTRTPGIELLVLISLCSTGGRATAQELEQDPVPPVTVLTGQPSQGLHGASWDGRVFFVPSGQGDWAASVFRPETVGKDARGLPAFGADAFSAPVLFPNQDLGFGIAVASPPERLVNPYPSDALGNPQDGGAYECYDLLVVTTRVDPQFVGNNHMLGSLRGRVVVANPRTPQATVSRAEYSTVFAPFQSSAGGRLYGIEPSVTFDGRVVFFGGGKKVSYSWNHTPGATTGWSPARSVVDMHHIDRVTLVDQIPFQDRYPIAQQPMRRADGTEYAPGENYSGGYPWISQDGTELFHTAAEINAAGDLHGAFSVIGRWTGYARRHIDGPLNPNRTFTTRLNLSSPGASPGFWAPYTDVPERAIPYTAPRPVYSMFHGAVPGERVETGLRQEGYYAEVSFEDHEDRDYLLYLHMNEIVDNGMFDTQRTADTSGGFHNGHLLGGAGFPQEVANQDRNLGVAGQAIVFPPAGEVRIPNSVELGEAKDSLSVQLFVNLGGGIEASDPFLAIKPGSFAVRLINGGRVQFVVWSGGQLRGVMSDVVLGSNTWTHLAFTYEGSTGALRAYVGGNLAAETTFGAGSVGASQTDLALGPANRFAQPENVRGHLLLDEVAISRVVRSPSEIARAAYQAAPAAQFLQPGDPALALLPLPLGLEAADLRVPSTNPPSVAAIELGSALFFDPRLSGDNTVSCATCHVPTMGFTDRRPLGIGISGVELTRNTPTVLNRALSSHQFLDGRAASLEEQALGPIVNPNEMGSDSLEQVAAKLAGIRGNAQRPGYLQRFQAAFGQDPSAETIGKALASFQRTLLTAGSRVDSFEAGNTTALSPSEANGRVLFRTKARCTACHTGSNYTDEQFHSTGSVTLEVDPAAQDEGRAAVTKRSADRFAFKTPTLRNLPETGPYFLDGSASSLARVVEIYNDGGLHGENLDPEIRPLGLTDQERADLVAFLKALQGAPPTLSPPLLPPN